MCRPAPDSLPQHADRLMPDFKIETASLTDKGRLRPGNEDAVVVLASGPPQRAVLAVADGVGGLKEGAYASNAVVGGLRSAFDACERDMVECLEDGLNLVNAALYDRSGGDETRLSGSTVVVLALQAPGATVIHAGDSRAYRLRDSSLVQLTRDHSWVNEQVAAGVMSEAEAASSSSRNIITRCVGVEPALRLERSELGVMRRGDVYLLCSDGLHGVVQPAEITRILALGAPLDDIAAMLVAAANAAGGPDNVTVAIARLVAP